MLFGCCTGHEEMPCDVDVVLEHVLKVMGEKNDGKLHNWKVKSPPYSWHDMNIPTPSRCPHFQLHLFFPFP